MSVKNSRSFVKGKTIKQLLDLDYDAWNALDTKRLRQVVSRLSDAANKRIKRLHYKTPASAYAKRSGGKFTTKGKNLQQLRSEYARLKGFLSDPTSTNKGFEKWKAEIIAQVKRVTNITIKQNDFDRFWDIYQKLYDEYPHALKDRKVKYETWRQLNEAVREPDANWTSDDEIVLDMINSLFEQYESAEKKYGKSNSVSDIF